MDRLGKMPFGLAGLVGTLAEPAQHRRAMPGFRALGFRAPACCMLTVELKVALGGRHARLAELGGHHLRGERHQLGLWGWLCCRHARANGRTHGNKWHQASQLLPCYPSCLHSFFPHSCRQARPPPLEPCGSWAPPPA